MTQLMTSKKILIIGSSNTEMSVKSTKLPKPGETVLGDDFRMGPGGKGANQAVAARRLGGDVTFICKLGKDMFGEKALEHYRSCGLDVSHILYSDKPSGIALITVDSLAENSIVVASGANADITPEDIEVVGSYREDHGPWAYTTVFAFEKPGHTVEPKANDDESMEICWVPIDDVPNRKLLTAMKTDWPRFAARLDELAIGSGVGWANVLPMSLLG